MPTEPPDGITLRHHTATDLADRIDQLADVYAAARAEPPYIDGYIWQRDAFVKRALSQAANPDLVLVTADLDGDVVGFAFGQPMAAGRWFEGDTEPPDQIRAAAKFAVIELNVIPTWRNRGVGRALLAELLARRSEQYAILSTLPTAAAHRMYETWGWRVVSQTQPDSDLPPWNTLALRLP